MALATQGKLVNHDCNFEQGVFGQLQGPFCHLAKLPCHAPCTEARDPDGNAPEAIACPRLNAGAVAAHHAATAPHVAAGPPGPVLLTLCIVRFLNMP